MKKLLFFALLVTVLIGCSSERTKKKTIQMNDVKWTFWGDSPGEEVSKQISMFELIPGPQQFMVTINKKPGETWYICELELNVKLNHSVDIDLSKILADKGSKRDANACANITAVLLDRNGERIKVNGWNNADMILFNDNEVFADRFVDYLTFLQSEPGSVFTLRFYTEFNEQKDKLSVGLPNLINEVKGCELELRGGDEAFERYVGVIE